MKNHLANIKRIQYQLQEQHFQALNNVTALHESCGGKTDEDGNFILNREQALLYFANGKHLVNYASIDAL